MWARTFVSELALLALHAPPVCHRVAESSSAVCRCLLLEHMLGRDRETANSTCTSAARCQRSQPPLTPPYSTTDDARNVNHPLGYRATQRIRQVARCRKQALARRPKCRTRAHPPSLPHPRRHHWLLWHAKETDKERATPVGCLVPVTSAPGRSCQQRLI